ncbi:OLC1v1022519C1 [Oldenlandia corymbosa var. corymbosa]|uniref:OLC1v1022519C1 n=1 Tax=Oldenlandia corymbosa var. corymbosa TaxID=529605 RepID=A0AAV1BY10_OLDCO|nr:OLC1v1022519C1 [Oldenlandia corymbosa var. corymbosa]
MAGLGLALDLLRKNRNWGAKVFHSHDIFSAKAAAKAAATSAAALAPVATWAFTRNGESHIAYSDAGVTTNEGYAADCIFDKGTFNLEGSKVYIIEVKPLLSAFHWKNLALTSLRSFLLFFLPLLEPRANLEDDDDDDFLQDPPENQPVDLVVPLKKSLKQIIRETTVVTTRRVLERLALHYVSERMAWKLLKDTPRSAARKAFRGMPAYTYIFAVSRTTLRGHFLGTLAALFVQVGIDIYRFFSRIYSSEEDTLDEGVVAEQLQLLGRKVYITTLRCGASLIFASIGAGIGAYVIHPRTGQWIGCALGDLAGPLVLSVCFEKLFHMEL